MVSAPSTPLFSASITPLLKTGSRKANASPRSRSPGAAQWREWRLYSLVMRYSPVHLPDGEVLFDPLVLFDLALEDGARVFHSVAREVLPSATMPTLTMRLCCGMYQNQPFSARRRRWCRFVDAFAALGILVVGPHGDLVEVRIGNAPAARFEAKASLPGSRA